MQSKSGSKSNRTHTHHTSKPFRKLLPKPVVVPLLSSATIIVLFITILATTTISSAPTDAPETSELEKQAANHHPDSSGSASASVAVVAIAQDEHHHLQHHHHEQHSSDSTGIAGPEESVEDVLVVDGGGGGGSSAFNSASITNNHSPMTTSAVAAASSTTSLTSSQYHRHQQQQLQQQQQYQQSNKYTKKYKEYDYEFFYKFRNAVSDGVKKALDECRRKFKWDRWNCPLKSFQAIMNPEDESVTQMPANKELGLTRALISSGIILSIVRSCSMGTDSPGCSCSTPMNLTNQERDLFLANEQTSTSAAAAATALLTSQLSSPNVDFSGTTMNQQGGDLMTTTTTTTTMQTAPQQQINYIRANNNNYNKFAWAGCDEVVKLSFKVAKAYLNLPEGSGGNRQTNDASQLISAHNFEVGRQVVKRTMRKHCTCHGSSGACQYSTCWTVLPSMSQVGDYLKRQYQLSAKVGAADAKETDTTSLVKELSSIGPYKLVFADASPDYCYENRQLGNNGTLGRYCSRTRQSLNGTTEVSRSERDSCDRLCTKCGYKIKREWVTVERQCGCKFVYCCSVECKRCQQKEERFKCVKHS